MRRELLRMKHVSVKKDREWILDNLDFHMFAGEIMGLVARSRKGQKEMISLICRNNPLSFGTVWYDGRMVNSYSYSDGEENKVALIEQKSHLVEGLSLVDNLFVLRRGFRKYFINERVLREQAAFFFRQNGLEVDLDKRVEALTQLERCLAELGKALISGCRLVIVDNPSNFLSQRELAEFQRMLKKIRREGVSVLYIGNHHQEVFRIADRTSLFSDGCIYKVFEQDEMTERAMAPYITEWNVRSPIGEQDQEEGILHFHGVETENLREMRFVLHRGECLTVLDRDNQIAGDIQELLTGGMRCSGGRITLDHALYTQKQAADYLSHGIAVIPEDCINRLLFQNKSYMENLTFLLDRKLGKSVIPGKVYRSIRSEYRTIVGDAVDVRDLRQLPMEDQFALVYHKMQILKPRVMVCIQPLADGDMFCRMRVLNLLHQIQSQGTAILIITSSVSDTLDIADRLLVAEHGAVISSYEKDEFKRIVR